LWQDAEVIAVAPVRKKKAASANFKQLKAAQRLPNSMAVSPWEPLEPRRKS
jgi:hypothetical protein